MHGDAYNMSIIYVTISVVIKNVTKADVYDVFSPKYLGFIIKRLYARERIPMITNIAHGIPKIFAYKCFIL